MDYFVKCNTIDELKKEYRRLAFICHPDVGGSTEQMQKLNNAYDEAMQKIGKANNKNYTIDNEYKDIIEALIKLHMEGITIEVCGWFIWITGNIRQYKKQLGCEGLGLRYHLKKDAWHYKPSWYYKKSANTWEMEKIRDAYGSKIVHEEKQTEKEKISA